MSKDQTVFKLPQDPDFADGQTDTWTEGKPKAFFSLKYKSKKKLKCRLLQFALRVKCTVGIALYKRSSQRAHDLKMMSY